MLRRDAPAFSDLALSGGRWPVVLSDERGSEFWTDDWLDQMLKLPFPGNSLDSNKLECLLVRVCCSLEGKVSDCLSLATIPY